MRSIALSTRIPREGEEFGKHYYFVSTDLFLWLLDTNQLLEYTRVYGYTFYGTLRLSVQQLLEAGKDVLFVVDSRGVEQISEHLPNSKSIFLKAPSDDEQRIRLERRGTKGEDLQIRIEKAHEELEWANAHNVPVVVNDILEEAVQQVESIFFS